MQNMEVRGLELQDHLKRLQLFLFIINMIEKVRVLYALLQSHALTLLLVLTNELSEFVPEKIDINLLLVLPLETHPNCF